MCEVVRNHRLHGLVGAGLLAIVAAACAVLGVGLPYVLAAVAGAAVVSLLAVLRPAAIGVAYSAWGRFGVLLGKIINPVILGALFFLIITPVAALTRFFGRDELRIRPKSAMQHSYWIDRESLQPDPASFRRPF